MPHRQAVFLAVDRALGALAPRGSRKCRKIMHRVDDGVSEEDDSPSISLMATDERLRVVLRTRCLLCPKRCREPLT